MMKLDGRHYVAAHEIGEHVYCPEAWRLTQLGVKPDAACQKRMAEGEREHVRWQVREDRRLRRVQRRQFVAMCIVAAGMWLWWWWQHGG